MLMNGWLFRLNAQGHKRISVAFVDYQLYKQLDSCPIGKYGQDMFVQIKC